MFKPFGRKSEIIGSPNKLFGTNHLRKFLKLCNLKKDLNAVSVFIISPDTDPNNIQDFNNIWFQADYKPLLINTPIQVTSAAWR